MYWNKRNRDLTIGDIIYNLDNKIVKVSQITSEKIAYHLTPNSVRYIKLVLASPVFITEAFLLNNEFIKKSSGLFEKKLQEEDNKLITISFNLLTNCILIDGKDYLVNLSNVKYIHELQHAFRVCSLSELANNLNIDEV